MAPSSTEFTGSDALRSSAASTANARLRATRKERGCSTLVSVEKAGGDAAVFAAPSTADEPFGATGAGGEFTAPWFGVARFLVELITPGGF